ncbi:MAG: methylmalonyl Co-A mutase-associated GTPase MeaB [Limisphaerales bacterium]
MPETPQEPQSARVEPRGTPPTVDELVAGVRRGDRALLGRAITLVESTSARHERDGQELLQRLLPFTGKARRVGITGVPGVGKSTFIDTLGMWLCDGGHRVAVLAIDPSSTRSGGSILGDKTRMARLGLEPAAFIRPSPTGGALGGVARRTRECILICEAAGFDVVLVETVGVGQSEVTLRGMVDYFLLLLLAGAGDDLQGIKRGIMEMADAVVVNKADGDNRMRAEAARGEQALALHHMVPATPGWSPPVTVASGLTGEGIAECWADVERFYRELEPVGAIADRRREQARAWFDDLIREELTSRFTRHPGVRGRRAELEAAVLRHELTPIRAVRDLFEAFDASSRPPTSTASPF